MKDEKHTPGPWGCPVCGWTLKMLCGGKNPGFFCENPRCNFPGVPARLIAAAPDLLQAALCALAHIASEGPIEPGTDAALLLAAIRKAKGE